MSNECMPKRYEPVLPVSNNWPSNLQEGENSESESFQNANLPLFTKGLDFSRENVVDKGRASMILDRIRCESTKAARIGLEFLYWVGSVLTGFVFLFFDWVGREIQQLINDGKGKKSKEEEPDFNNEDGASVDSVPISVENEFLVGSQKSVSKEDESVDFENEEQDVLSEPEMQPYEEEATSPFNQGSNQQTNLSGGALEPSQYVIPDNISDASDVWSEPDQNCGVKKDIANLMNQARLPFFEVFQGLYSLAEKHGLLYEIKNAMEGIDSSYNIQRTAEEEQWCEEMENNIASKKQINKSINEQYPSLVFGNRLYTDGKYYGIARRMTLAEMYADEKSKALSVDDEDVDSMPLFSTAPSDVEEALCQLSKQEKDVFLRIEEADTPEAKAKLVAEFKKELGAVVDDELFQGICGVYEKPEWDKINTAFSAYFESFRDKTNEDTERSVAKALFVLEQLEMPSSDQGDEQWYKRRIYDFYEVLRGQNILDFEFMKAIYSAFEEKHQEGKILSDEYYISVLVTDKMKSENVTEVEAARSIINERIAFHSKWTDTKYIIDALKKLLTSYEEKAKVGALSAEGHSQV